MPGATLIVGKDNSGKERPVRVGEGGSLGPDTGTYMVTTSSISDGPYAWIFAHVDSVVGLTTSNIDGDAKSGMTLKAGGWYRACGATTVTKSSGELTVYKS